MKYQETDGGRSNGRRALIFFLLTLIVFASARMGLASGFGAATNYTTGAAPLALVAGDFNRDGKMDLAAANADANSASVLLGNGNGTFKAAVNYAVGLAPYAIAAGDFNGDGRLDLATTNYSADQLGNNVSVLYGKGTGTFETALNFGLTTVPYTQPVAIAAADLNRDGKADLAIANYGTGNDGSGQGLYALMNVQAGFTIGGRVTDGAGHGVSAVTVALTGAQTGTATTDTDGNYSFLIRAAGTYTLTPSKTNYSFDPPSRTFTDAAANQTANFTATLNRLVISGKIKDNLGGFLRFVTVKLTGSATSEASTDTDGNYSFDIAPGGNYTVTPTATGYAFTPASRTYTNLSASQTLADFAATFKTFSVTGRVTTAGTTNGIGGVTMTITSASPSGFAPRTVLTNSTGYYTFPNLPAGRNYIIKPAKMGLTFTPTSRSITNLSTNLAAGSSTNFTGAP